MSGVGGGVLRLRPVLPAVQHFVEGFKYQPFPGIGKPRRDLPPQPVKARAEAGEALPGGLEPAVGPRVVMHVQQAHHALVQHPARHFGHPVHPAGVHLAVDIQMLRPGDGHADGTEAGVLHCADQPAGGEGIVPGLLRLPGRHVCSRLRAALHGVQGVAQVPSGLNGPYQRLGGGEQRHGDPSRFDVPLSPLPLLSRLPGRLSSPFQELCAPRAQAAVRGLIKI